MSVEKRAYEVGRRLAKLALSNQEYAESIPDAPIWNRVFQHGAIGAGAGALAGAGGWAPRGHRVGRNMLERAVLGAGAGAGLGALTGSLHGAHDAGLRTGYRDQLDSPVLRSALAGYLLGEHPLYGGLAALAAAGGETSGKHLRQRLEGGEATQP